MQSVRFPTARETMWVESIFCKLDEARIAKSIYINKNKNKKIAICRTDR